MRKRYLSSMLRVGTFILAATTLGCAGPITKRIQVDDAVQAAEAQKQKEAALAILAADIQRLHRVGEPIRRAAVSLCGEKTTGRIGFFPANRYAYGKDLADTATRVFSLGDEMTILDVEAGAPAARAGLKKGDILLAVNDITMPVGPDSIKEMSTILTEASKQSHVALKIRRDGKEQTVTIEPEKVCAFSLRYVGQDAINAFADGKQIIITRGMMRFAQSDTELALVIAHELAHNAMDHIDKQMGNRFLGAILDGLFAGYGVNTGGAFGNAAALTHSEAFEAEADYVGLYMAVLANYRIEEAQMFWRRMAAEHPASIGNSHNVTHPPTPYRFTAMEKAVAEIREKQRTGQPLVPDLKAENSNAARQGERSDGA